MTSRARKINLRKSGGSAPNKQMEDAIDHSSSNENTSNQSSSPSPISEKDIATQLEDIRKEGHSLAQLRNARRKAEQLGIESKNALDAVRLLREQGEDPFAKPKALGLVPKNKPKNINNLPAVGQKKQIGKAEKPKKAAPLTTEQREMEIESVRQGLVKRRRRRVVLMMVRLFFFIVLPTAIATTYYYKFASPFYESKTDFSITVADGAASAGGLGALLKQSPLGTQQDAILLQAYLLSPEAMLRLDKDEGFRTAFSDKSVDVIYRLDDGASNDAMYKIYKQNVKVGYDPSEGVMKVSVIAPTSDAAFRFAEALLSYSVERVDQLSFEKREDTVAVATQELNRQRQILRDTERSVIELQKSTGELDLVSINARLSARIGKLEAKLDEKENELSELLENRRPLQSKVNILRRDITRYNKQIADIRSTISTSKDGGISKAEVVSKLRIAEANLASERTLYESKVLSLDSARVEAGKQVRFLSIGVSPIKSSDPAYPRRFENSLLAFIIFAGLYLMISLTFSVIREQVSV